jgi:hypothetical protein
MTQRGALKIAAACCCARSHWLSAAAFSAPDFVRVQQQLSPPAQSQQKHPGWRFPTGFTGKGGREVPSNPATAASSKITRFIHLT